MAMTVPVAAYPFNPSFSNEPLGIPSETKSKKMPLDVLPPTVTVTGPAEAASGTITVSSVSVDAVTSAAAPLNLTALSPGTMLKLEPEIVIISPCDPLSGLRLSRTGVNDAPIRVGGLLPILTKMPPSGRFAREPLKRPSMPAVRFRSPIVMSKPGWARPEME